MAKKTTHADRERREQMLKNAERTRQLAEKAQAELDKRVVNSRATSRASTTRRPCSNVVPSSRAAAKRLLTPRRLGSSASPRRATRGLLCTGRWLSRGRRRRGDGAWAAGARRRARRAEADGVVGVACRATGIVVSRWPSTLP